MTFEELKERQEKITHGIYQGQMRSYTNTHLTDLTISFAIEVLEDIHKWWEMGSENQARLCKKIEELKKLTSQ